MNPLLDKPRYNKHERGELMLAVLEEIKARENEILFSSGNEKKVVGLIKDMLRGGLDYTPINDVPFEMFLNIINKAIAEDVYVTFVRAQSNNNGITLNEYVSKFYREENMDREATRTVLEVLAQLAGYTLVISNIPHEEQGGKNDGDRNNDVSPSVLEKGNIVNFGYYEWQVLRIRKNTVLLVLNTIADVGIPYNDKECESTTWESCSLRVWLNNEFYNRFTPSEKQAIIRVNIPSENNQWYGTDAGAKTSDNIFLLSISDVVRYYGNSGQLNNRPFGVWNEGSQNGLSCAIDDQYNYLRRVRYKGEETWWWLRTPGESENKVAYVNTDGLIFLNGELAFDDGGKNRKSIRPAIRPAMFAKRQYLDKQPKR